MEICKISLPVNTFDKLQIWKFKSPFKEEVGRYNEGDVLEVLEKEGNIWKTDKGYINGVYTKDCEFKPKEKKILAKDRS